MTDAIHDPLPKSRRRGRAALANPVSRFDAVDRVSVDDGWDPDTDLPPLRTETRIETIRKAITRNTSPDLSFDRSLNPYRGCEHGCIYCFARPSHGYLGLSSGLDFETHLVARPGMPERLAKELSVSRYSAKPIAIGANTDPYQPIERQHRVMRRVLEVLWEFRHPVTITTKGSLIERDLDLLAPMAAEGLLSVGISVTTLDPGISRAMEPRVPTPKRRLATIRRLSAVGVPVRVMASPMIPALTDPELEAILEAGRDAGATAASWILLRLPYEVAQLFRDWLRETYPARAARIMARVRESHGGKDYDAEWGKRMRGEGPYAEMIAQRYHVACKRLGLRQELDELRTDLFRIPPRAGDQLSLF